MCKTYLWSVPAVCILLFSLHLFVSVDLLYQVCLVLIGLRLSVALWSFRGCCLVLGRLCISRQTAIQLSTSRGSGATPDLDIQHTATVDLIFADSLKHDTQRSIVKHTSMYCKHNTHLQLLTCRSTSFAAPDFCMGGRIDCSEFGK